MALPETIRRIFLTGFMGAGKSTVGARLAESMGWRFLDLDAVIEERTGRTIAQIFEEQGEAAFRALEMAAMEECAREEEVILALGGGAVETTATRTLLAELEETCVIFLDAPLEVMIARCLTQPGAAERPVLAATEHLPARLAARLPWYREAHLTVATEESTPEAVVERILEQVRDRCGIRGGMMEGSTEAATTVPAGGKGRAGR